ncbi:uncharacterized protein LOC130640674 [Hydractinia symbiolongicarpus]|uniref:uncharacterized protein LOC130640674 n=1 Tax=Hydractinia symbiolongicarpus TaxID=13093 RepID=UPI00254BA03F|nr:uncharacterized protein LOC130640674 [Hydractinia symbiolongicarpus]
MTDFVNIQRTPNPPTCGGIFTRKTEARPTSASRETSDSPRLRENSRITSSNAKDNTPRLFKHTKKHISLDEIKINSNLPRSLRRERYSLVKTTHVDNKLNQSVDLTDISTRLDFLNNLSDNITKPKHCKSEKVSLDDIPNTSSSIQVLQKQEIRENKNYAKNRENSLAGTPGREKLYHVSHASNNNDPDYRRLGEVNHPCQDVSTNQIDDFIDSIFDINWKAENSEKSSQISHKNVINREGVTYNLNNNIDHSKTYSPKSWHDEHLTFEDALRETQSISSRSSYTTVSSLTKDLTSLDVTSISSIEDRDNKIEIEQARLKTVLSNIDPKYLLDYLKRHVKHDDRSFVLYLSKLLPRTKFTGETTHCVRCHKEYDAIYGDQICVLPHKEHDVILISEDDVTAVYQCESCFSVFSLKGIFQYSRKTVTLDQCGACFIGKHSSDVNEVKYRPEGVAQTCADKGCIVYFV